MSSGTWVWTKSYMTCGDQCCSDDFENVEEALDSIEMYCRAWTKLEEV